MTNIVLIAAIVFAIALELFAIIYAIGVFANGANFATGLVVLIAVAVPAFAIYSGFSVYRSHNKPTPPLA